MIGAGDSQTVGVFDDNEDMKDVLAGQTWSEDLLFLRNFIGGRQRSCPIILVLAKIKSG